MKRILLTGGGSGGHVYPLLAVREALQKIGAEKNESLEFHYCGPNDNFSKEISELGIKMHYIASSKLRRYASVQNFLDIPKFFVSLIQTFFILYFLMPDVVFSKGGPGALPVVFSAWFYRIPVVIHESDAIPGLTTLLTSRFSKRIAISFEETAKYFNPKKIRYTGNPIRSDLGAGIISAEIAKSELGFDSSLPLVLILGGSQGSERINECIALNLEQMISATQILHQTGDSNFGTMDKYAKAILADLPAEIVAKFKYQAVPYLDSQKMRLALSAADIVISRAGSGSIFEISYFGKPAILIPLQGSANDHQRANAYAFEKTGGARVIEEANLSSQIVLSQLRDLLQNTEVRKKMSDASKSFSKGEAAHEIGEELIKFLE